MGPCITHINPLTHFQKFHPISKAQSLGKMSILFHQIFSKIRASICTLNFKKKKNSALILLIVLSPYSQDELSCLEIVFELLMKICRIIFRRINELYKYQASPFFICREKSSSFLCLNGRRIILSLCMKLLFNEQTYGVFLLSVYS